MNQAIEKIQIVQDVWVCGVGHKHLSFHKARHCETRRRNAGMQRRKAKSRRLKLIEMTRGHLKCSDARDRFWNHNFSMSSNLISLMYRCGLLRGFRMGKGNKGKIYVREDDIDNMVTWVKQHWDGTSS